MLPLVSVIVPYKEDRGYLKECLDSINNQTYSNIEVLKCVGGSPGENMQAGINKANGKYTCYVCDDDIIPVNSIKDRVEFIELSNFDFIHSRGLYLYPDHTKPYGLTNPYAQFNSILESNGVMGGSTFYRSEMLKKMGWEDHITSGERINHLRFLKEGYTLGFLDKVTYYYRRWNGQKSIGNMSPEYQAKRKAYRDEQLKRFL